VKGNKSTFERILSVFTEVRRGEGVSVLALTCNILVILTAYYLIKPVREALILSEPGGAELKSYASAGLVLLLLLAVPAYGWLASRVPRMRLIHVVTVFFAACLVGFYLLIPAEVPLGIAFFLWVGIFNLMVPAQFWAFANDIYTPEAGKRLFVLVAFGASAGAVFGSFLANEMIRYVGIYEMLLVAAVLLVATLLLTHFVNAREAAMEPGAARDAPAPSADPIDAGNPFGFVFRNRYLLLMALMVLFNNWVNANGEYILGRIVSESAAAAAAGPEAVHRDAFIAAFYARYFGAVNLLGMLLQLFVVSRVIKYIGVPVAVCLLPLIVMGSYTTIAVLPLLTAVRWVKTLENSTDYSLQNTIKQVLYLPTTRTEKYKAKQAIDTLFVRLGDVCSAALVLAGTQFLGLGVQGFAIASVALATIWLGIAVGVGRRFSEMVPQRSLTGRPSTAPT